MPPLPLDERIVVIQRPKNLSPCGPSSASPQRPPFLVTGPASNGQAIAAAVVASRLRPPHSHPFSCDSLGLECKRRSLRPHHLLAAPVHAGYDPSHCHSNGTVTLGPRLPSHTHTIDIKLSVDKGAKGGGFGHAARPGGSAKGGRGRRVSLHFNQADAQPSCGGALQFVPAQSQQRKAEKSTVGGAGSPPGGDREASSVGSKKNSKLGTIHQNHQNSQNHYSLLPGHQKPTPVPLPHASVLNSSYLSSPPFRPPHAPAPFRSGSRDRRPPVLPPGLPLAPCSSRAVGRFPSPDHTCTINLSYPFSCGCWELLRRKGFKRHSASCQGGGGGNPLSSFSRVQNVGTADPGRGKTMVLKTLGGCLSNAASNTSSSDSAASECRAGLFKPPPCVSCSREAGNFESPAMLRKKLVGGCLPCGPLTPASPLRAFHSCVTGCNAAASQTSSSTCSYCSSDPIVVTFNPRRSKPPGDDDDDYSVRTIWPEELAKKMTRSQNQSNHGAGTGLGSGRACQNSGNGAGLALLDCQNLQGELLAHPCRTDRAGRRRLWQGKMASLDFMGPGCGQDGGHSSLKRLLNKDGDPGAGDASEPEEAEYPRPPSPRCSSPQSPVSFSASPSAPGTLIKPTPRQRDREGGRSLPAAQSMHLVLNSLNREQNEENSRMHLSLPLSSSLPASLSDESAATPDAESAAVSPILPFLFLGNESDAQDLDLLLHLDVGFVVNVTTHLPLYHLRSGLVRYKRLPATDNSKQNLRQYFEEVFEFIEEAHQTGKGVLVHCQAGVSRSATVVIAYLMKHTLMTMTDAYKYVRSRRPVVSPNLNFMGQLLEFERDLNSGVTPRILMPKLSGLETQV